MKIKVHKKYALCFSSNDWHILGRDLGWPCWLWRVRADREWLRLRTWPSHGAGTSPEDKTCKFSLDFSHQALLILPPNQTSHLPLLCLPCHWVGSGPHYMSPGLVSLPPASTASHCPQPTSIRPPPCYRNHLLKLHYVAPPPSSLQTFHWLPVADPIKPKALSMARPCGIWLLLTTNPASLPPPFPPLPKSLPNQIRVLGHSSSRPVVITVWRS